MTSPFNRLASAIAYSSASAEPDDKSVGTIIREIVRVCLQGLIVFLLHRLIRSVFIFLQMKGESQPPKRGAAINRPFFHICSDADGLPGRPQAEYDER
jgi:hypothetical protein